MFSMCSLFHRPKPFQTIFKGNWHQSVWSVSINHNSNCDSVLHQQMVSALTHPSSSFMQLA
uniref:Uncharacterized protein n=1 Tax=Octopus bimaculoides TaxID=37653 RepID=A0A0L8GMH0_OCTBM